jgi:hypothetical protein
LAINVAAGLCYSHVTSIVHARTVGVKAFDKARIESILAKLQDIPCMRVDSRLVEGEVMSIPDVDKAEFTRNVFGNALLTVQYRTPVAKLAAIEGEALSIDGVLYHANELPPDLPALQLPQGGPPTLVALEGNWQPQSLAALSVYARRHYPRMEAKIEVNRRGVVCLNIGSGRVVLGSCDDLDVKLKTLESRLQKNPQELDQVEELNLTSPSVPAIVPKKLGNKSEPLRIADQ